MSRLIDADYVLQKLENFRKKREDEAKYTGDREAKVGWSDAIFAIKTAPTVQPEIIKCKDCKYLKRSETNSKLMMCRRRGRLLNLVSELDYCSKAERKADD